MDAMTMSPEEFRQRYAAALTDEPPHPPVEHDIAVAQGRHRLRRRRIAGGVSACLAVVAIVGGSALVLDDGTGRDADEVPPPAQSPTPSVVETGPGISEDRLLEQCRHGELQDPANAKLIFASGSPVVKATAFTRIDGSAALESADGRYWAWCRITPGHPEWTGMDVYKSTGDRGRVFFYYTGDGCGPAVMGAEDTPGCTTFRMRWAERVSPEVATMVFVMGNGQTVRLEGHDGYFINEFVGELPDNVRQGPGGDLPASFQTFRSVTYLDADGVPIAAQGPQGRIGAGAPCGCTRTQARASRGARRGRVMTSRETRYSRGSTARLNATARPSVGAMHRSRIGVFLIDHPASSYDKALRFWGGVQGVEPVPEEGDDDYASLGRVGSVKLEGQRLGEGQPRVHLDIETDDVAAEVARVVDLGATVIQERERFTVLQDPGGLIFCVVPVQTGADFDREATTWGS
jgi:predicted enzyme related to lactoylglutathione lyase